jgi:glucose-1-phosphatase
MSAPAIRAVFFDLGGVLVELGGEAHMLSLMGGGTSLEALWRTWLSSPAVRDHETGRIGADAFATALVAELGLAIGPAEFLAGFRTWIRGPFEGAHALVDDVRSRYRTALLTNTSGVHWPLIEELDLTGRFHHVVASHLVGEVKPDPAFYRIALEAAGIEAAEALFLDDNQVNIEGARACGMQAERVYGAAGARAALVARGLIEG